jgi:hypothetical protein
LGDYVRKPGMWICHLLNIKLPQSHEAYISM